VWDQILELVNVATINNDGTTDGSSDNIAWELEEVVGDLGGAKVLVVEASDEDCLTAVWVEFLMDGTLWEDVELEGVDVRVDDTGTVLENERGVQASDDWNVQLGGTGMGVWGIETARSEETDSHTGTGTNQSWEGFSVGDNNTTGITGGDLNGSFDISEIENKVLISEQSDTIQLERGGDQFLNEIQLTVGPSGVGGFRFFTQGGHSLSLLNLIWSWSSFCNWNWSWSWSS